MKLETITKLNINMGTNNPYDAIIKCVWQGLPSDCSRPSLGDCHTLPSSHGWLLCSSKSQKKT